MNIVKPEKRRLKKAPITSDSFGTESVSKILFRLAPAVMLAQLILALYNIVDSFFIGRFSADGLTALSVIYPVQLLITALSVGTGVGVNTLMARRYAQGDREKADMTGGTGIFLAVVTWLIFAVLSVLLLRAFISVSAESEKAMEYAYTYGMIVCVGSLGTFLESSFTKIHQADGNMFLPTIAQIAGAVTNIILDPVLIFGLGPFKELGIAGAAVATVCGQFVSAAITGITGYRKPPKIREMKAYVGSIYKLAFPSILMQGLFVVYIMILNVILADFSDSAVSVLGLYYKLQTFFFIPMFALETCVVPVLSYNYARMDYERCKKIILNSVGISAVLMLIGVFCFEAIPGTMIGLFSKSEKVLEIGIPAFRIIGLSFLPAVASLMTPTFFQAIGAARQSTWLSLTRQLFCLIPIFWLMSRLGVEYTWIAFPVSEVITGLIGVKMYAQEAKKWQNK